MVAFAKHAETHDDLVGFDAPCHVKARQHTAEDRVLAVEVDGGGVRDEELAPTGVRAGGLGHGKRPREVFAGALASKLVGNPIAGATRPCRAVGGVPGVGVAGLGHEVRQHPVKLYPLVVAGLRQRDEVGHGVGGLVLEQFHHDATLCRDQLDPRQIVRGGLGRSKLLLPAPQFRVFPASIEQRLDLSCHGGVCLEQVGGDRLQCRNRVLESVLGKQVVRQRDHPPRLRGRVEFGGLEDLQRPREQVGQGVETRPVDQDPFLAGEDPRQLREDRADAPRVVEPLGMGSPRQADVQIVRRRGELRVEFAGSILVREPQRHLQLHGQRLRNVAVAGGERRRPLPEDSEHGAVAGAHAPAGPKRLVQDHERSLQREEFVVRSAPPRGGRLRHPCGQDQDETRRQVHGQLRKKAYQGSTGTARRRWSRVRPAP